MSGNIYNLTHPLRSGRVRLAPTREMFGTVIRQGRMDKTVTVRVSSYTWNHKVGFWITRANHFHCHDGENYCRTGDKVVIQACRKLSKSKYFFVHRIILAAGRQNFYTKDMSQYELDAIKYNEELRAKTVVPQKYK